MQGLLERLAPIRTSGVDHRSQSWDSWVIQIRKFYYTSQRIVNYMLLFKILTPYSKEFVEFSKIEFNFSIFYFSVCQRKIELISVTQTVKVDLKLPVLRIINLWLVLIQDVNRAIFLKEKNKKTNMSLQGYFCKPCIRT